MKHKSSLCLFLVICTSLYALASASQPALDFNIIAYYYGDPDQVASVPAEKLTHIIFSFCHLTGNKISVDNANDAQTINNLVALKKRNPNLKVLLSMGGWGGCETCSDVFTDDSARKEFAQSVLELSQNYTTDGIDIDWEYPAIEGYPGFPYKPEDKPDFTALVKQLRETLGTGYEISFAAGGFEQYLEQSIEWDAVMEVVDRVNVMSYDLVNGYSKVTGHQTPLYSNPKQQDSANNAVQYLVNAGVPPNKIAIGSAFYARVWENVGAENNGLYQAGDFKTLINYVDFPTQLANFTRFWDMTSRAPYGYDAENKLFATFDNKVSVGLKSKYVVDQKLNGIMFWEVLNDSEKDGLVDVIYTIIKNYGMPEGYNLSEFEMEMVEI